MPFRDAPRPKGREYAAVKANLNIRKSARPPQWAKKVFDLNFDEDDHQIILQKREFRLSGHPQSQPSAYVHDDAKETATREKWALLDKMFEDAVALGAGKNLGASACSLPDADETDLSHSVVQPKSKESRSFDSVAKSTEKEGPEESKFENKQTGDQQERIEDESRMRLVDQACEETTKCAAEGESEPVEVSMAAKGHEACGEVCQTNEKMITEKSASDEENVNRHATLPKVVDWGISEESSGSDSESNEMDVKRRTVASEGSSSVARSQRSHAGEIEKAKAVDGNESGSTYDSDSDSTVDQRSTSAAAANKSSAEPRAVLSSGLETKAGNVETASKAAGNNFVSEIDSIMTRADDRRRAEIVGSAYAPGASARATAVNAAGVSRERVSTVSTLGKHGHYDSDVPSHSTMKPLMSGSFESLGTSVRGLEVVRGQFTGMLPSTAASTYRGPGIFSPVPQYSPYIHTPEPGPPIPSPTPYRGFSERMANTIFNLTTMLTNTVLIRGCVPMEEVPVIFNRTANRVIDPGTDFGVVSWEDVIKRYCSLDLRLVKDDNGEVIVVPCEQSS